MPHNACTLRYVRSLKTPRCRLDSPEGITNSCSSGGWLWFATAPPNSWFAYPLSASPDRLQRTHREAPRGNRNPPTTSQKLWHNPLIQRPAEPCLTCQQRVAHIASGTSRSVLKKLLRSPATLTQLPDPHASLSLALTRPHCLFHLSTSTSK